MNPSLIIIFQLLLITAMTYSNPIIKNEEELEDFLQTAKLSRESKQTLREYQREGLLTFPLDPFNFLSQIQSLFAQLPNLLSSFFKLPSFFGPADTRVSSERDEEK